MNDAAAVLADVYDTVEQISLESKYHDILTLIKGFRNGLVYGAKVRLPHAMVVTFLFRSGAFKQKIVQVWEATRQHALFLGMFSFTYKAGMLLLRRLKAKENRSDALVAGFWGGFLVFGLSSGPVNRQIVMYVLGHVVLGLAKASVRPEDEGSDLVGLPLITNPAFKAKVQANTWPLFAGTCWAVIMYLFRWHPECLTGAAWGSMHYIYEASDQWKSLWTLLVHNE